MGSMTLSRWTSTVANRRRQFDPKKKAGLEEFAYFHTNNRWRDGCPFYLEWPHMDVVAMCKDKYISAMLVK